MKYVLDASVAVRWVVAGPLTQKAIKLRDEYPRKIHELVSPDIYIDEVASALTKTERQKTIPVGDAAPLYVMVMNTPPLLVSRLPFTTRAIDISSQTRAGYYDCLYVALAEHEQCVLLTADDKLARSLQPRFPFIKSLASLP